ncbi:hypothetical protein DSL72_006328 [Monilinia vaccinii-corymbosi]|uniref:Probable guanine deaminase n=1 Tax=Monilinia vaccinii-corymbosi TaxID=61207 RepID=A0A8A3PNF0_9HELO|nr:hypothetical protein DSL72_006328 [Monilinia vaccinii-corymbosi]
MAAHTPTNRLDKKPPPKRQVFAGTFVHSKSLTELEILHDTCVYVDEDGVIVKITTACGKGKDDVMASMGELGWDTKEVECVVFDARSDEGVGESFFFPGFVDTHIHAPQYPNSGIFGSSTLLDWLNTYTFPLEASLSSRSKAHAIYSRVIQRTLSHGTTTAAYFATIHVDSTNLLADLCLQYGQRALVGRCCMDSSSGANPDYYRDEDAAQSLERTKQCIEHCEQIDPTRELITAILTPRFAPSCTRELLGSLGKLAVDRKLPIQTHISENRSEVAWVGDLFSECGSYAAVYDKYGCLTPDTILAHAVHISEDEARLIRERGSGIAHCPVSNSALASGVARVRWMLDRGLRVGLGTDVSGGFSASVLVAAREASCVSRCVAAGMGGPSSEGRGEERDALSVEEVLYLATRGGAEVVGMEERIGGFEVGKQWDAQLVGFGRPLMRRNEGGEWEDDVEGGVEGVGVGVGPVDIFGWENWEERIAKWVFNGDDRNTVKVWVKGRLVHQRK